MKGYDVAGTIEATPQQAWDIPTNAAGYTSWHSVSEFPVNRVCRFGAPH